MGLPPSSEGCPWGRQPSPPALLAASPRQLPLHEEACGQCQPPATARQPGAGHATCTETFQAGSPVSLQPGKAEDAVRVPCPLPRLIPRARGAPGPPNLCWAKAPGASPLPAPWRMGAASGHSRGAARPHGTPRHSPPSHAVPLAGVKPPTAAGPAKLPALGVLGAGGRPRGATPELGQQLRAACHLHRPRQRRRGRLSRRRPCQHIPWQVMPQEGRGTCHPRAG